MEKTLKEILKWNYLNKTFCLFLIFFSMYPNNSNSLEIKDSNNNIQIKNEGDGVIKEDFLENYLEQKGTVDYILGVGDVISISLVQDTLQRQDGLILPTLTNFERYSIEGDGTIFLPRFNKVYVEGLTLSELKNLLEKKYQDVFLEPVVNIKIVRYRPIQIFIDGEVENPGLYTFPGRGGSEFYELEPDNNTLEFRSNQILQPAAKTTVKGSINSGRFPDLYSVIKKSGGITAFSDLSNIQVIRKNSISNGGGKIKAEIDFLEVIQLSDNSNNIRILDGDRIFIKRSPIELTRQLSQAVRTSLNPKYINVVVNGRVENAGQLSVSKTSTLNDVIKLAGGTKILKGPIEFTRFKNNGEIESRKFNYSPNAKRGGRKNPYMKSGDIVSVGKGAIIATKDVIDDITSPFLGIYSTYAVLDSILN